MIDWLEFFNAHDIEFRTSGPNVSKGNVAIACPYCGSEDPSQHMSVSLTGAGWYCFRRPNHRGKNPARLISALIGCSWEQAQRLAGNSSYLPQDFASTIRDKLSPLPKQWHHHLTLPQEFKLLNSISPSSHFYLEYLRDQRGFSRDEIRELPNFNIRYCTRGAFKGRIIFPVFFNQTLVSWTGRTIFLNQSIRYKTLSDDPEKAEWDNYPPALGPITDYLLFYDELDGDTICLCEGPMDALKIRLLGQPHGITGTCFFTSQPSAMQIDLLHEILPRFKRRVVLLDRKGTFGTALDIKARLATAGVRVGMLPSNVKDPAELSRSQLLRIIFRPED